MKIAMFFLLTFASLSAMANPCDLEVIEDIVDGQVGVKFREVLKKAYKAQESGDEVLFEKTKKQANKMMEQVVDLATTACE